MSKVETIKLMSVVGARPQFIKAAALSRALRRHIQGCPRLFEETIIHTGQHYDDELSRSFFDELEIPDPLINLGVGSASHGIQTAGILVGLERVMREQSPDWVIIYGDTNSTAAAALAAAKLKISIAHVEAGLREHNRRIPEEVNKIIADHLADLCFAPTETAMKNLEKEGLAHRAVLIGDLMLDTTRWMLEKLSEKFVEAVLNRFGLQAGRFILATTHRAVTRESPALLGEVLEALRAMPVPVLLPLHPATRAAAKIHKLEPLLASGASIIAIPAVKYAEMLALLTKCKLVITDSGGLIKEAYFFAKPCITIDYQTEWTETLEGGWNLIAGPSKTRILELAMTTRPDPARHKDDLFGDGSAARKILETLDHSK